MASVDGASSNDSNQSSDESSDEVEICCDPCLTKDEFVEAEGFCEDCQENLCATCLDYHPRTKASRHHTLLERVVNDVEKIKLDDDIKKRCKDRCSVHTNQIVKFQCADHATVGCGVCMTLDHRICQVDYIPDVCVGIHGSREVKSAVADVERKLVQSELLKKKAQTLLLENELYYDKVVKEMDDFEQQMTERLKHLKQQLISGAEKFNANAKAYVDQVVDACEKSSKQLSELKTKLLDTEHSSLDAQIFIAVKQAQHSLTSSDISLLEAELNKKKVEYIFEPNRNLINTVNSFEGLGRLVTPPKPVVNQQTHPMVYMPNQQLGLNANTTFGMMQIPGQMYPTNVPQFRLMADQNQQAFYALNKVSGAPLYGGQYNLASASTGLAQNMFPAGTQNIHNLASVSTGLAQNMSPVGTQNIHNLASASTCLAQNMSPVGTQNKHNLASVSTGLAQNMSPVGTQNKHNLASVSTGLAQNLSPVSTQNIHNLASVSTGLAQNMSSVGRLNQNPNQDRPNSYAASATCTGGSNLFAASVTCTGGPNPSTSVVTTTQTLSVATTVEAPKILSWADIASVAPKQKSTTESLTSTKLALGLAQTVPISTAESSIHGTSRRPPSAENSFSDGKQNETLTASNKPSLSLTYLKSFPPQEQKQIIGEELYPVVKEFCPDLAGKVTGMLLELPNSELLELLVNSEKLKRKCSEASDVLQAHAAKHGPTGLL